MRYFLTKWIKADIENKKPGQEGFPTDDSFLLFTELGSEFTPIIGMTVKVGKIHERIESAAYDKEKNIIFCHGVSVDISEGYTDDHYVPMGMSKEERKRRLNAYLKEGWKLRGKSNKFWEEI